MDNIPHHIGVILDGNRRWAREKNLPTFEGHKKGLNKLKSLIDWSYKKGIKILTVYIFSTENWNRSKEEVSYLMNLFKDVFQNNLLTNNLNNVKIKFVGEREMIPEDIQKIISDLEEKTKTFDGMTVNLAFSYGGRKEIIHAVKGVINKKLISDQIDEDLFSNYLYIPDNVDLIIRRGKERRLSGFLTWQSSYAELYFMEKYWPDFNEKDLDDVLLDYSNRQRRFGK